MVNVKWQLATWNMIKFKPFLFPFYREMDRDVVGAAASIFIVSSIKVPSHTNELISTEMNHELPDQQYAGEHKLATPRVCPRFARLRVLAA